MIRALSIARIGGIEIRVHVSLIFVVALVTLSVATQAEAFPPDWSDASRFAAGGVLAVLFLASILIHELAHGIVARRRGLPVRTITLAFFGGITTIDPAAHGPRDEAAISSSGPIASLAVGLPLAAIGFALDPTTTVAGLGFAVVGIVNVGLGLLNLLPAMPLDGGRLLHAYVWERTGDPIRAGRATAVAGRYIGIAGVIAGILVSILGDSLTGALIVLSGWFIVQGSRVTERRLAIEALLSGLRVGEVMERDVTSIGPQLTVDTFADQLLGEGERTSVPVMDEGALVGVLGIAQLRRLGRKRWPLLRAADIMVSKPTLPSLTPEDAAWAGMELLRESGLDGIPVESEGSLLGLLTRKSLVAAIQARTTDQTRTRA